MPASFEPFREKMDAAGLSDAAVNAFARNFETLAADESAMIPESAIEPARDLPSFAELDHKALAKRAADLVSETVVIKLNGGLGTGMGLEQAKSLIEVRDGLTFLDLIVKQVDWLRRDAGDGLRFLLMNSYATSRDSIDYLEKYPDLGGQKAIELMQSRVPKIDASTLEPVAYPEQPDLEWCPPGHGDLYPSLLGTGWLDLLLAQNVKYAFVSNSDNLGATLDLGLLGWFAESDRSFLMEVTARTAADRKGGHLAVDANGKGLLLRESAQCLAGDKDAFQDIDRHRYFNTNNLWIRLDRLKVALEANGGILPLPVIRNAKTVNPRDKNSTPVLQLETAMGAAIQCFDDAEAIDVPRSRFAPVKTTDDLLALRSDAYELTPDFRLQLKAEREEVPPLVDLDPAHFKLLDGLEQAVAAGVPSLLRCDALTVRGPVRFSSEVEIVGDVTLRNASEKAVDLPAGLIENDTIEL